VPAYSSCPWKKALKRVCLSARPIYGSTNYTAVYKHVHSDRGQFLYNCLDSGNVQFHAEDIPKSIWQPGYAQTCWGAYSALPDLLDAFRGKGTTDPRVRKERKGSVKGWGKGKEWKS